MEHNHFVTKLYKGEEVTLQDLIRYKIYNKTTLSKDNEEEQLRYLKAPVIVKTNREAKTITYLRAQEYARRTKKIHVSVAIRLQLLGSKASRQ